MNFGKKLQTMKIQKNKKNIYEELLYELFHKYRQTLKFEITFEDNDGKCHIRNTMWCYDVNEKIGTSKDE